MREALKELKAILKWRNQYAGTVHRNSYAERSKVFSRRHPQDNQKKTKPEKKGLKQNAEFDYSQLFTSTSSKDDAIPELIDITPDEGDEMSRSSSTSPIPSEAENEDEIEEEESFAEIQIALDDPGVLGLTF
ncbi:hypothetical protein TNCV_961751 [Trichonephila clavipes]|nr:hypothetical protein TNCV_961751 [Trichonephila clavipes]